MGRPGRLDPFRVADRDLLKKLNPEQKLAKLQEQKLYVCSASSTRRSRIALPRPGLPGTTRGARRAAARADTITGVCTGRWQWAVEAEPERRWASSAATWLLTLSYSSEGSPALAVCRHHVLKIVLSELYISISLQLSSCILW